MVFTLEFRVHSISPEPLGRFSLNFTQIFLSVRRCAEFITRLHRLKIKVTLQDHVIYPSIHGHPISPRYFEQFSINFTRMFLSMKRCAEQNMIQLPRLNVKVTGEGHVIYPSICVRSISPESFELFTSNFTQCLSQSDGVQITCPSYLDSRSQVRGYTLEFRVRYISPEPLGRLSLNFTQMFLSVKQWAEHMT